MRSIAHPACPDTSVCPVSGHPRASSWRRPGHPARASGLLLLLLPLLASCGDATAPPPVPASMQPVSGDAQVVLIPAPAPEPLVVRVVDDRGAPVAGVTVGWSATRGTIDEASVTDADGHATATWFVDFLGPATAKAAVAGLVPVHFSLSGRMLHIELTDFRVTPDSVSAAEGPASIRFSAGALSEDRVGDVLVRLVSPDGSLSSHFLELVEGTPAEGRWEGTVEIPQGAPPGSWTLNVTVAGPAEEGCHCLGYPRVLYPASALEHQGFSSTLVVRGDP